VYIIVCAYVHLVVFVVFFLFCSISFSTLILLVGSFDLYCVGGDVKHCSLTHITEHISDQNKLVDRSLLCSREWHYECVRLGHVVRVDDERMRPPKTTGKTSASDARTVQRDDSVYQPVQPVQPRLSAERSRASAGIFSHVGRHSQNFLGQS